MSNKQESNDKENRIKRLLRKFSALGVATVMSATPMLGKDKEDKSQDNPKTENKELASNLTVKVDEYGVVLDSPDSKGIEFVHHDKLNTYTAKQFKKAFKKLYKNNPTMIRDTLSAEEFFKENNAGTFCISTNEIKINHISESEQELMDSLQVARSNGDKEKAELYEKALRWKKSEQSTEIHEKIHAENIKIISEVACYVTSEQMMKLCMIDEIVATMGQVKLGWDTYKKTGNLKDIDGYTAGNLADFKSWIETNPDSSEKECLTQLGISVYKNWLDIKNFQETNYYKNSEEIADYYKTIRLAGAQYENEANIAAYTKAANQMLKNSYLGDMRELVDINFTLDNGSSSEPNDIWEFLGITPKESMVTKFMKNATDGAKTVPQATRRIRKAINRLSQNNPENIKAGAKKEIRNYNQERLNYIQFNTK